jgi:hypothetical protein
VDYIRLMTNLSEHRKWLETSDRACKVLIGIWLYCGRNETDGFIPIAAARREGLTNPIAEQLETRGWLLRNGDGWYVHDWGEHQVSAEEIKAKRAYERERKRQYRNRVREH